MMSLESWKASLTNSVNTLWERLASFVPNVVSAILLVLLGYAVSKLAQKLATKFLYV